MATIEFRLPDLGEGLEDAEVVKWLVAEGENVSLNQPLVEVDTAKALVEIPSPVAGKVAKLHAMPGDVVKVGAALVTFEAEAQQSDSPKRTAVLVGYGVEEGSKPKRRRHLKAASARSSPTKRAGDELAAAKEERIPVRGVRRIVAQKMAKSATEIPHVTTFLTVDATQLLRVREAAQTEAVETKITPLAVVGRAFVEICKRHPKLNASWDAVSQEIVLKRYYHLGIATDAERGLVVPVVKNADSYGLVALAGEINRVVKAARAGASAPADLTGSTVTISNVGTFGAEFGTPIINYPESSILAVGMIEERPVVYQGDIAIRPTVVMSLAFDHRIADGAEAGRALLDLKTLLEDPELRSLQ